MCGISGALQTGVTHEAWCARLEKMARALQHRGPDDAGMWCDPEAGVGFAHRRLAIVDLSPAGHQPMLSACGRFVMVFNGEIYNYQALRKTLEASDHALMTPWRGHSDTEVILEAIRQWGLEKALAHCNGMFALALWDRQERVLSLARDRLGEKPLYYGWQGATFMFGSELKALKVHPDFYGEIQRDALTLLMRYSYIPAPHSIYQGIYKLLPGTLLRVAPQHAPQVTCTAYWSAQESVEAGVAHPLLEHDTQAVTQLDTLLRDAVRLRMIADVPLGAFLSGGIDSSVIVALMQAQSSRPIKTFSIGFHEGAYNEAGYARLVAEALGTDHTEFYVTPEQAMTVIPQLPALYDEPFADASQIPTFLVSQLARTHVTVSLSGDGGDELFGGYNRYVWSERLWKRLAWIPAGLRQVLAHGVASIAPTQWDRWFARAERYLPQAWRQNVPGDRLHKLAEVLAVTSPTAMYHGLVSQWKHPERVVLAAHEPSTTFAHATDIPTTLPVAQWMMFVDLVSYLPDDILVKLDRASMGVSLEARVPFLDHRVVDFAWRIPLQMKLRHGQGKWLLRQVLYRYVPQALVERPKAGFGVPLDAWLRGPLREWSEALLSTQRLRTEGFFNPQIIRDKWESHLSGQRNWYTRLWNVLMFQAWLDAQ